MIPDPPGDLPLIEGLSSDWNEFVSVIPEDKRAELGPKLKERVSNYENKIKEFEPWSEFQKSGVTPEHVDTSLRLFSTIENNPKEAYEVIGKSLGITPAAAKEVVKEIKEGDSEDPQIQALKKQVETMSQIMIAQRQMTTKEQQEAEANAAVEEEINSIKKKYGDNIPEDEILMRMVYKDMSAEEAYAEYSGRVSEIQKRRPAPFVMGTGGTIPNRSIDVKALDNKQTKSLVAQMLDQAKAERG